MARVDRLKRSLGTALRRTEPSRAARWLVERGLASGRVLDYACGYGFDADHFSWDGYDPYYRPPEPRGPYDAIVCNLVLNVLSRNNRAKVVARMSQLLADDGHAYLVVARNVPATGKLGVRHCLQNYVVLSLPLIREDAAIAIYDLTKTAPFGDRTRDFVSRRDRRRDR